MRTKALALALTLVLLLSLGTVAATLPLHGWALGNYDLESKLWYGELDAHLDLTPALSVGAVMHGSTVVGELRRFDPEFDGYGIYAELHKDRLSLRVTKNMGGDSDGVVVGAKIEF